jgi:hypothetical protein
MPMLKTAASCWRRAAEVETQAAKIADQHLKAVYLLISGRSWPSRIKRHPCWIFAGRGNIRVDPPVDLGNDTARERAEV